MACCKPKKDPCCPEEKAVKKVEKDPCCSEKKEEKKPCCK